jgi:hypothetical protein
LRRGGHGQSRRRQNATARCLERVTADKTNATELLPTVCSCDSVVVSPAPIPRQDYRQIV